MNDKTCPKCSGVMTCRLGAMEYLDCGYIESPGETAEDREERGSNPFTSDSSGRTEAWQRRGRREGSGPPQTGSGSEPYGFIPTSIRDVKEEGRDSYYAKRDALAREKHTYMAVLAVFQFGGAILTAVTYSGAAGIALGLPGALAGAFIAVLAAGFVLYSEAGCIRTSCIVFIVLGVLSGTAAVVMAIISGTFASVMYMLPALLLNGWLLSILYRDAQ